MEWISVEWGLPETKDLVLTYSDDIEGHKERLLVPNLNSKSTFPSSVTHWMPLPEPPKQNSSKPSTKQPHPD